MRRHLAALAATAILVAACGSAAPSSDPSGGQPSAESSATAAPSATATAAAPADTVWLCKPGLAENPCAGDLDATLIAANGSKTVEHNTAGANPAVDCFYVYPTVSRQKTVNATLSIDAEQKAVAKAQAAQFSRVCQVYAPMYRQLTLAAIETPSKIDLGSALVAYSSVEEAFRDYMAHYNHGRQIVFIGHSQGALMLRALLRGDVDGKPEWRKLLVSALLLGGNVTVEAGKTSGGDFTNIPACTSATQKGCVVAYSTFSSTPPANALFGRADSAINFLTGQSSVPLQVLCVNPAAPGGGSATLHSYFPDAAVARIFAGPLALPKVSTPFMAFPGEYSAQCKTSGGATWLQVTRTGGSSDVRPVMPNLEGPTWGLHLIDVNIALGDLVELVRTETAG